MLKHERHKHILDWLEREQKVLLPEISRQLNVSPDTIRRDIKELSVLRLLKEVRGGAIPHSPGPHNFQERANFASRQKQEMARKAVQLVKYGNVLILDSGTSAMAVASLLPGDFKLTVFTNSFPIVDILSERSDVEVVFAGGRVMRESQITTGHETIEFFKQVRADLCFLGVCSIDLEAGLTAHLYEESAIKKAMIGSSAQIAALSTPEKINTAEAYPVCPIQRISCLITSTPSIALLKPYREAGIKVL